MDGPAATATPKQARERREWGAKGDAASSGSAFGGLSNRGKRGGERGGGTGGGPSTRGRGAGRGGRGTGRGGRGGGPARARGASGSSVVKDGPNTETSVETTTKASSKASDATAAGKSGGGKPRNSRRASAVKSIPQITVPPPPSSSAKIDEINAFVEHVRAGALTPNGPITPFTPSHIDWAGDDEDDGSLPDLDDWGVSTATSTAQPAAISPIIVEGLKSLPEPKVPDQPEPENEEQPNQSGPTQELKEPSPPQEVDDEVSVSPQENSLPPPTSTSLHPSLPPKPLISGSRQQHPKNKQGQAPASVSRPPRERKERPNKNNTNPKPNPAAAKDKPVSGGVSLSTPTISTGTISTSTSTAPEPDPDSPSPLEKKGLTDSMHAPKDKEKDKLEPPSIKTTTTESTQPSSKSTSSKPSSKHAPPALLALKSSGVGAYVPPHRSPGPKSAFVPTPAPPPPTNGGGLAAEFTFPSLSPSPISGHYPVGPRGPGGGPPKAGRETGTEAGGRGREGSGHEGMPNGHGQSGRGNPKGRGTFNNNRVSAPRHLNQHQQGPSSPNSYRGNHFNHQPYQPHPHIPQHIHNNPYHPGPGPNFTATSGSNTASPHPNSSNPISQPNSANSNSPSRSTSRHTPRHTPQHSREHSASRPVITGDAISKLARTIAGSPQKANA